MPSILFLQGRPSAVTRSRSDDICNDDSTADFLPNLAAKILILKTGQFWQSYGRELVERSCLNNTVANGPDFSSATLCSTCVVRGVSSHFARVRCSAECSAAMSSFTCSMSMHTCTFTHCCAACT